jgi:hypothetical protein
MAALPGLPSASAAGPPPAKSHWGVIGVVVLLVLFIGLLIVALLLSKSTSGALLSIA